MISKRIPDYCFWCGEEIADGDEICAKCVNEAVYEPDRHPPLDAPGAYDFGTLYCDFCGEEITSPFATCLHCGHLGWG